jgi:HSP20 family protein
MTFFRFMPELDPVNGLLTLQRELERAWQRPFGGPLTASGHGVFPPVNVFNDPDGYVVRVEVPGVAPDQLKVEGHGRTLTISGTRTAEAPQGGSFHRRERSAGQFARSLQLPEDLDLSKTEASYKHGMLTIRVPKREEAKPRQISVKAA